jgi:hypothetical protein
VAKLLETRAPERRERDVSQEPQAGLDGPSRTIILDPVEEPQPLPERVPEPVPEEPAEAPEREPEKIPA